MFFSEVFGYVPANDVDIQHEELVDQNKKIHELTEKISAQEQFINNIQYILRGEIPVNTPVDSLSFKIAELNLDSLETEETQSEKELTKKLKEDLLTESPESALTLFSNPVNGEISQRFDKEKHPGVDIVTSKDDVVKACLAGTVVYSGYSRKDGYILIVDHGGKYISLYKHNRRALKKSGDRVKLGDPIAVVGNTGENSTGPHLHFELWMDQRPVNPEDYMSFRN